MGSIKLASFSLRAVGVSLAVLAGFGQARAESLSERRQSREKIENVELEVACGKLDKENCAIVVPEIGAKTAASAIRLKPLESKGSVESINGLCDGDVGMAVVQADVLAARVGKPDCIGKVVQLGSSLYPYQGFMIVRSDVRSDKFADMADGLKPGNVLRVAAGGPGSGGELTFRNILAGSPEWKSRIDLHPDGSATALSKLMDRQLDAFFVMDGPQSPLLKEVRETIDNKTKQRAFKFVDFRPAGSLLALQFNGHRLYGTATIEAHWFSAIRTISTPAVIAIRDDLYKSEAKAITKVRQAAEDALPAIAAKTGSRPDWTKDFARE
jgi:TRAP-type uncharacterized transport system substrate-binding protein